MDVVEDALELFKYCLDFYQEWSSAQRQLKTKEMDTEFTSLERELFANTLQRHVEIAKKLMLDLYADFDLYVIDKNRNPFVILRPGKKSRKLRFGRKRYGVEVSSEPHEVFGLFDHLTEQSFTKKELDMLNKLYRGTVGICRLQDFMTDIKDDPPAEKGEEAIVEMVATDGTVVRGILTYSPYATTGKDLDDHLEAIDTCKNMSGIEMHFIHPIEFGLKIIVAKLRRMRSPYVTAIQNVVKISEVPVKEDVRGDVPVEGVAEKLGAVGPERAPSEIGAGDAATWEQQSSKETPYSPFAEYPEAEESDQELPYAPTIHEQPRNIEIPSLPNMSSRSNCCIQ